MKKDIPTPMLKDSQKNAIKYICSRLRDKSISWAVIGSTNMALNGIDVTPNDIDIITDPEGIKVFGEVFSDKILREICRRPAEKDRMECFTMKLEIEGEEIEVIGEKEDDIYYSRIRAGKILSCPIDDKEVPCLALEAEAEAYDATNRQHKSELIRAFLKKRSKK